MKRTIQILLVTFCLAAFIPAAQAQVQFGVKAGVNMSKASLSRKDFNTDNFTGFFLGPVVDITVPIVGLGLDAALLYSQKGVTLENKELHTDHTIKQKGIDIPINLKYNIGFSRIFGIYLAAGPDFFFVFDSDKGFSNFDFKKKKSQVGLNFGAGIKLLGHIHAGLNYNIPLNNSAEIVTEGKSETNKYKTRTWQFSVAYMF